MLDLVYPDIHWQLQFATDFDELCQPVLVMNWKCDRSEFHWLGGYLDVTMVVHLLLTYPDLT